MKAKTVMGAARLSGAPSHFSRKAECAAGKQAMFFCRFFLIFRYWKYNKKNLLYNESSNKKEAFL